MNTHFGVSEALEVLTDLVKDVQGETVNKVKQDINTCNLLLSDKGYLLTEGERLSLLLFIGELNSNANSHTPVSDAFKIDNVKFSFASLLEKAAELDSKVFGLTVRFPKYPDNGNTEGESIKAEVKPERVYSALTFFKSRETFIAAFNDLQNEVSARNDSLGGHFENMHFERTDSSFRIKAKWSNGWNIQL